MHCWSTSRHPPQPLTAAGRQPSFITIPGVGSLWGPWKGWETIETRRNQKIKCTQCKNNYILKIIMSGRDVHIKLENQLKMPNFQSVSGCHGSSVSTYFPSKYCSQRHRPNKQILFGKSNTFSIFARLGKTQPTYLPQFLRRKPHLCILLRRTIKNSNSRTYKHRTLAILIWHAQNCSF